ncbi:hypothetical protein HCN44_009709 [Aphidius gifuensis]|uniref:Uncharacterized protein n=1 Tax=Aphidius gifuensis TaxID=684658 RepID=A0A834Y888_APHGI|nr:hypothetical protein HCN44_009709 [Aphidius gifuensis]
MIENILNDTVIIKVLENLSEINSCQPRWEHEWMSPSKLTNKKLINIHQVVQGPFTSPRLIKSSQFLLNNSSKMFNSKNILNGIPDPLINYLPPRKLYDKSDKNSIKYVLGLDNVNVKKSILKIGIPFEQGIPDPWRRQSIETVEIKNKKMVKNKSCQTINLKSHKYNLHDNKSEEKIAKLKDSNHDELEILNDKSLTSKNSSKQFKNNDVKLICCQCNCPYLKLEKLNDNLYKKKLHDDDHLEDELMKKNEYKKTSSDETTDVTDVESKMSQLKRLDSSSSKASKNFLIKKESSRRFKEHVNDVYPNLLNKIMTNNHEIINKSFNQQNYDESDVLTSDNEGSSIHSESSKNLNTNPSSFEEFSNKHEKLNDPDDNIESSINKKSINHCNSDNCLMKNIILQKPRPKLIREKIRTIK